MTTMTVPVRLTKNDISVLADELNDCSSDSSELAVLLERILKSAYETAERNKHIASEMNDANPFSNPSK